VAGSFDGLQSRIDIGHLQHDLHAAASATGELRAGEARTFAVRGKLGDRAETENGISVLAGSGTRSLVRRG
jgi:hypothetical protein